MGRDARVGNYLVDLLDVADAAESTSAKFRTVAQYYGLLRRAYHGSVEVGLQQISGRKAILEVDTIHSDEEFATRKVLQHALGVASHSRE